MAGEFDFIRWIRGQQTPSSLVQLGVGDDLAVLRWPAEQLLLVGVDQVLDGIHFDSRVHSPRAIGRKAMNRNLSDCAAMACLPAAALATVALPRDAGIEYAKELFLGIRDAGEVFGCPVVGGDTGSWPGKLALTVTIFARCAGVQPITRGGARPGDSIYVSGPLGGSILGRHMTFTPRVRLARTLAADAEISAMIDLSDGLSRDLRHICRESGVGAIIDAAAVSVHDDVLAMPSDGRPPLEHALHDGEDYELLFTSPRHDLPHSRVGQITDDPGIFLDIGGRRVPLEPGAWEHTL